MKKTINKNNDNNNNNNNNNNTRIEKQKQNTQEKILKKYCSLLTKRSFINGAKSLQNMNG